MMLVDIIPFWIDFCADSSVSYIYEDVYRTTINWLNHKPTDALWSFTLYNIITDLVFPPRSHAIKGSKKRKWFSSQPTSKSQMMWPTTFYKLNLDRGMCCSRFLIFFVFSYGIFFRIHFA
ncbi:hypothetical protein Hanom_Chr09g00766331 [Helianthus anomalus]